MSDKPKIYTVYCQHPLFTSPENLRFPTRNFESIEEAEAYYQECKRHFSRMDPDYPHTSYSRCPECGKLDTFKVIQEPYADRFECTTPGCNYTFRQPIGD